MSSRVYQAPDSPNEDWSPLGYKPGPDDPGPIETDNLHGNVHSPEPLEDEGDNSA